METTSLTRLLAERPTIEILNANFENPVKQAGAKLFIEPPKGKRLDFGGIGHAYDYWVRCQVATIDNDLVASFLGFQYCREQYGDDKTTSKALKEQVNAILAAGRESGSQEDLLKACLFLAKFEIEYRSGYAVQSLDVSSDNVNELARLASGTDLTRFKKPNLVLHPIFCAEGSKTKIQADGDIIVEGVLVDLKTSSRMDLKDNLRQLIGYWALNDLAYRGRQIDRVAVYYPRFDYFREFRPSDLMSDSQMVTIKGFFASKLGKGIRACRGDESGH